MQVTWDETQCCHAGVCVSSLPEVFKIKDGRFVIEPDNASVEDLRRVVAECPSGALKMSENNRERS
ncbi:(4Fe-4S)-binding protein [Methylosarcina fibrata]|uniref:(4Fe-4S)-binding protein n=1 Tax=Methylosarcina fibrata TaxID=105972 RepID=UPI0003640B8C|nr:(4Fe-4S)-binding protein [Methylosarcina fibrata]